MSRPEERISVLQGREDVNISISQLRANMAQSFEKITAASGQLGLERPDARRIAMWCSTEFATSREIATHFGCSQRTVVRAAEAVEGTTPKGPVTVQDTPLKIAGEPLRLSIRKSGL